jgi:hypothetical protein
VVRLLNKHISEIISEKLFNVLILFKVIENKPVIIANYNNRMERMDIDFFIQDRFGNIEKRNLDKFLEEIKKLLESGKEIYEIGIWIGDMEKVNNSKEKSLIKYLENKFNNYRTIIIYNGKKEG